MSDESNQIYLLTVLAVKLKKKFLNKIRKQKLDKLNDNK